MPVRKSLRLQVFLVVALVASCLVCNTCLTVSAFAQGPKYLKVLLSPHRFQRALVDRSKQILLPKLGSWYPGNAGAVKVVGLSGEADELLDTVAKFCKGKRDFEFLLPRCALGNLLGPDGSNLEEFRKELKEVDANTEVNVDSEIEHFETITGSAAEAKVNVSQPSRDAVQAVAKWIMDNQDVQDALSHNLDCGYASYGDSLNSEILVKLSPECMNRLLRNRGEDIQRMRQEFFVRANIDEDYNDVTISGRVGDVSAFHRQLVMLERAMARKPQIAE